ncbi:TetR family transcriptional regulator [Streptomyces angustmyceticus]|uniref:TetR family transcriptional regulator n=1 Tax=Streptomyces angustmyceticus TaxID=285578 RepID=A0A5J4L9K6_9ACTN|nr:TetR family transcriptional regulator [Streptomyces angustmyceticus]UAL67974.1 TetR family transcriptional regulator [Streptomyces angustmyceticus]GES30873.1 TetR family transcriptional regulator [Streptomyces angustmyceticus]
MTAQAEAGTGTNPQPAPDAATGPGPAPDAARDPVAPADPGTGRTAILRAARRAFALRPYAEVTLRGIAADAGVSASLIVKRFGSKEQLFAAVADFGPAADALFGAPLPELGRHMVRTLVGRRRAQQGDPLLRVVFSLGISDERSLLRDRFQEQITGRLAALLTGPDAALRAELVAAQLIGLGATLSIHRDGAAAGAPPERLADLYAPALQRLLEA